MSTSPYPQSSNDSSVLEDYSLPPNNGGEHWEQTWSERTRLLNLIDDAIIVRDTENRIVYWNSGASELYGWTREEALGCDLYALLCDSVEIPVGELVERLRQQDRIKTEVTQNTRDGRRIVTACRVALEFDRDGKPLSLLTTYRDITERKQAENERELLLAQARAEYEQKTEILESIGDIFYAVDENFNFIYVNHQAEEAWGTKRQNLIGRNLWDVFPRLLGSESHEMHLKALAERRPLQYETVSLLLDHWINVRIYPRNSGGLSVYFHDINERKIVEESLYQSEERLRIAVEAAGLGTWDWNLLTDDVLWNEWHYLLFGIEPESGPVKPSRFLQFVHPDDREFVSESLHAAIRERSVFDVEFRVITANETVRWMSGYGRVVEEVEGEAVRMCGVMFDSTQRRLAEEGLRKSEERLRTIVNQTTASVIEMDLQGRFTFVNQTFCRATGYTEAQLSDMRFHDITHPDDLAHCLEVFDQAVASGESFFSEKRIICRDGSQILVNDSISRICDSDDNPQSVVAVLIDVTEHKRAEVALRESEESYRAIIDQASVGILQCDLSGQIKVANDRLGILLGYSTEELLQSRVQDLTHEDDIPFAMNKFVEMIINGVPVEVEKRCVRRDGSHLWVSASVSPVRDERGRPHSASVIIVDITQRKEAQGELRRAHDELEQRVRERTQELAQALDHVHAEIAQRKKAEAVRDKLLRQVVHAQEEERRRLSRELHDNMGQHLTAILLAVQAVESQNQALASDDQQAMADKLARLRGMVDELLNVSHRLAWEIRPALLDNIGLEAALEQYVVNWSQKNGIESDFVSRVPGERTSLSAEAETALFRVAQEALTNVQRHSTASQVSVVLEENEDSVAVIVEDNGQGIDLENTDYSTRLGLLGMQERLELVGGTLTLESGENVGLTVYARVSLPKKTLKA